LQCTGLVQFSSEAGRKAALVLNKSLLAGQEISVTPSRFSLIPVAAASVVDSATETEKDAQSVQHQDVKSAPTEAVRSERIQPTAAAPAKAPSAALAKYDLLFTRHGCVFNQLILVFVSVIFFWRQNVHGELQAAQRGQAGAEGEGSVVKH
jgi:hypothetical protein